MPAITADPATLHRINVPLTGKDREVKYITTAPQGYEGEGFPVRRAFAGVDLTDLDPFVHMDQMGEVEYAPGEPKGTPWHPHRGFETFTYIMDGTFLHQDSHGGGGVIENGATQYMTAGSGILHIETPPEELVVSGGVFHGVQLWINLPQVKKLIPPAYQNLEGNDITLLTSQDATSIIRLLAGGIDEHAGPGHSQTPMTIAHVTVLPGGNAVIPWDPRFNALAYVFAGRGTVSDKRIPLREGQLAVLNQGDSITLESSPHQDNDSSFEVFLLGGLPLREPVVAMGPFVMNTRSEVLTAFEDYQKGRFGQIPPNALQPFRVP